MKAAGVTNTASVTVALPEVYLLDSTVIPLPSIPYNMAAYPPIKGNPRRRRVQCAWIIAVNVLTVSLAVCPQPGSGCPVTALELPQAAYGWQMPVTSCLPLFCARIMMRACIFWRAAIVPRSLRRWRKSCRRRNFIPSLWPQQQDRSGDSVGQRRTAPAVVAWRGWDRERSTTAASGTRPQTAAPHPADGDLAGWFVFVTNVPSTC